MGWHLRAFCKCGFDAGEHLGGDIWFAKYEYPVCPKCGTTSSSSFEMKTVRRVRDGWFKYHYETKDGRALLAQEGK